MSNTYNYKAELALVNMKQKDVLHELQKRGHDIGQSGLSMIMSGDRHNPRIEDAIIDIIRERRAELANKKK